MGELQHEPTNGLVALMSHDLKTPLGPLTLAVSTLADSPGSDETRGMARIALSQADRLRRLIDAALVASGRRPHYAPAPHSLAALVVEAVAVYERTGGQVVRTSMLDGVVFVDRPAVRDAFAGLLEVVAGDGGTAVVDGARHNGRTALTISASGGLERTATALRSAEANDSPSAFAIAGRLAFEAFGGGVELLDEGLIVWLPEHLERGVA